MKTFLWYWRLVCRWLVEAYFDNTTGLAAMMAYDLIFIVVAPGLFLLSEALSLFGTNPSLLHQIIELIKGFLPEISRDVIQQQVVTLVMSGSTSYVALLGVPLALYLGINLINTVSRTLNHCLGIPEPKRSWWNRWIIALVLLFWFGITLLFSVSAIVFGERLAGVIQHTYHLGFDLQAIVTFWKYPVIIVALMVLALSLYLLTPEVYQTVRQALPGSVFFSLSWLVSTAVFGFYVKERGSRYQETYQTYANLIVLLTWTWLTCLLLLLAGRHARSAHPAAAGCRGHSGAGRPRRDPEVRRPERRRKHRLPRPDAQKAVLLRAVRRRAGLSVPHVIGARRHRPRARPRRAMEVHCRSQQRDAAGKRGGFRLLPPQRPPHA